MSFCSSHDFKVEDSRLSKITIIMILKVLTLLLLPSLISYHTPSQPLPLAFQICRDNVRFKIWNGSHSTELQITIHQRQICPSRNGNWRTWSYYGYLQEEKDPKFHQARVYLCPPQQKNLLFCPPPLLLPFSGAVRLLTAKGLGDQTLQGGDRPRT